MIHDSNTKLKKLRILRIILSIIAAVLIAAMTWIYFVHTPFSGTLADELEKSEGTQFQDKLPPKETSSAEAAPEQTSLLPEQKETIPEKPTGAVMPEQKEAAPEKPTGAVMPEQRETAPEEPAEDEKPTLPAVTGIAEDPIQDEKPAVTGEITSPIQAEKPVAASQESEMNDDFGKKMPVRTMWKIVFCVLLGTLAADLIAAMMITVRISKLRCLPHEEDTAVDESAIERADMGSPVMRPDSQEITVGNLHHIGARPRQEDCSGFSMLSDGVLAVVCDGMGGLSGGDRISQSIVYTILNSSNGLAEGLMDGVLPRLAAVAADTVNKMLGEENYYKSGSTLLAVLIRKRQMHWLTIGDSHIYLFRDGELIQLNQEHNRGQDLMICAARGEMSFEEVRNTPKKGGLTSFIGMGKVRSVENSLRRIPLQAGDRIILATDGVFNTLTDETMISVLTRFREPQAAADQLQALILHHNHPKQDNFTAVILGI